ncbi:MAG: hypothetical protein PUE01_07880 [Clostridiaceae bacterium]|nr:hypothetical protein [Clostridiaceae bacterium]
MISTTKKKFEEEKNMKKAFSFISEFRGDEITPIVLFNGLKGKRNLNLIIKMI